jgi:alpha-beta hydrolase superfamily lysophospholipase
MAFVPAYVRPRRETLPWTCPAVTSRSRRTLAYRMAINDGGRANGSFHASSAAAAARSERVFERVWDPHHTDSPKAGLIIVHGYGWHSGWWGETGDFLGDRGVRVSAADAPGHGKSDLVNGVRGHVRAFDDLVAEVKSALNRAEAALPAGTPLFLLGESFGGLVVTIAALEPSRADRLAGIVLAWPAIAVSPEILPPPLVVKLVRALGNIFPTLPVPGENMSGKTWDQAFGDPVAIAVSKEDPLTMYGEPLRFGFSAKVLPQMDRVARVAADGIAVPAVLLVQKEGDTRTPFPASAALVNSLKRVPVKSIVRLSGQEHQLMQDRPEVRKVVLDSLAEFICSGSQ